MADYIASVEGRFDNQVSAGADAATASLNRTAAAADGVTVSLDRVGPSASTLVNRYDAVTQANNKLGAAMRDQAAAAAALSVAQAAGSDTAAALERAFTSASAKVETLRAAQRAATMAVADGGAAVVGAGRAMEEAAVHAGHLAEASTSVTRELIVMGHEALTGRFSRIPGSMLVIGEHAQNIVPTLEKLGGYLANFGVIGTAGVLAAAAALVIYEVETDNAAEKLIKLQNTLRGTREDYSAAATEVLAASKAFAATTPGVSRSGAEQAAQTIVAAPEFTGSTNQLEAYLAVTRDLSLVMNTTLPDAAKTMALAFTDPEEAAKKATADGLTGFNVALDDNVKHLQASGDLAKATALVIDGYKASVTGSVDKTTELDDALTKLGRAWGGATSGALSFADELGGYVNQGVIAYLDYLTLLLKGVQALRDLTHSTTPAGASGFVGVAGPLPATTQALMPTINAAAGATGIDPALLARLQAAEGVRNPDGSWQTSPTGAVGAFQVTPTTFAGMRADPKDYPLTAATDGNLSNTTTNATAASELMAHLLNKYQDPYTAILAYHDGETVVDKMLNNGRNGATTFVSPAARDEANVVTAGYQGTGFVAHTTAGNSTRSDHGGAPPTTADTPLSSAGLDNAVMQNADEAYGKSGVLAIKIQDNQEQQSALEKGIQLAGIEGDTETVAKYSAALAAAKGAATDLISEQDKMARSAAEATASLASQSPVVRDLAAIQQKYADAARTSGQPVNQADVTASQTAELAKLQDQHNQSIATTEQDTAAQLVIAKAYDTASGSIQHVQDAIKAADDARATALPGSVAEAQQIAQTTAALDANAAARADVTTAQQNEQSANTIQQLQLEIAGVNQSTAAQAANLEVLKEKQAITDRGGDPNSSTSQQALADSAQIADLTSELKRQRDALTDLSNIGTSAFNSLGQAITNAFVSGGTAGINLHTILSGIESTVIETIAKLAILDPLLNAITGSNDATLSDAFDAISGSTGDSSSSGSSGGLLSDISSIAGAGKSLFSGGSVSTGIPFVDSILGTSTGLGASTAAATGEGAAQLGSTAVSAGATGATAVGGATIGGLLGGVGAGFSLGTVAGQALGASSTNSEIGSAAGSIAGAAIGSIIPGVGTIIGGIVGGLIGGSGSSLFGGAKPHNGWDIKLGANDDGQLGVTNSGFEGTSKLGSASAVQNATDMASEVNDLLSLAAAKVSGSTVYGGNNNSKTQATDFNEALETLTFSSVNPIVQDALASNGVVTSINNLADVLGKAMTLSNSVQGLANPLTTANYSASSGYGITANEGSIQQQSTAIWDSTFAPEALEAANIGDSSDYAKIIQGYLTQTQRYQQIAANTIGNQDLGYTASQQTAQGQTFAAANTTFQQNADSQRQALQSQLDGLYGTAYETTQAYADQFSQLNKAIAAQASALATQQAQQTLTDRTNFAGTAIGYRAATATANGETFAAAQDTLSAQAASELNSAVVSFTALLQNGEISQAEYNSAMDDLNTSIAAQQTALDREQAQQTQTDRTSFFTGDMGYIANTETAQGDTIASSQQSFNAQAANELNQAIVSYAALLQNGEISQAEYNSAMGDLNTSIAAQQTALNTAAALTISDAQATYSQNSLTYEADRYAAAGDAEDAALANFDASASQQQVALTASLTTMLQEGAISTQQYYAQITDLDTTLAQQRLAIQQQYVDAAKSQITSEVSSLNSFLTGLEGDIGTPASQLANTRSTYQTDLLGAKSGNVTDLANLQQDASSFLAASKTANGAGTTAYNDDLASVISGVSSITGSQALLDTLTTATMAQIAETQTQKLTDALALIQAEVAKLNLQMRQATLAP